MFLELGIPVFIADDEAKLLMNSDETVRRGIIDIFGAEVYSEAGLDRKRIAGMVFKDREKLDRLNAVVHPAVARHFDSWKKEQQSEYLIYEAAILFETGGYKKCDATIIVTAPKELRIERLLERDASSLEEIEARMNNQWSDEKKAKMADFILENIDISKTRNRVREIHEIILKSA
jgi:dephospho-CoA kinase